MPENIILVGFMGTGKSTIGRKLSLTLGYPLVDTDQLIVEKSQKSIPHIFEDEGEEAFRQMETQTLKDLAGSSNHIISTGGGIIGQSENRKLLKNLGYVVWLIASPAEILNRTERDSSRPLLNNDDPLGTINDLLKARTPHYEETAHLSIETDQLSFDEITTGVIESARYYFSNNSL